MRTRVEIFKNDTWVELVLKEEKIKYNVLSNKIGNFEQRRISHSNTFALPYVSENIIALDINTLSPVLMAEALNKKFPARYFVKDKLLQKGFLVINNTIRGEINVNFIDEALVITDEWGRRTFKQLLHELGANPLSFTKSVISTNFMNIINILKNYETDKTLQVQNAPSSICSGDDPSIDGSEVYIARYPNLLNAIGDKFNLDSGGNRKLDGFNPFQSRPIFSIFGFLYIVCQAFGYRLRLDPSVDFELLRDTYLTGKSTKEGTPIKDATVFSITPTIPTTGPGYLGSTSFAGIGQYRSFFFKYPNTTVTYDSIGRKTGVSSKTPNEIGGYTPSPPPSMGPYRVKVEDINNTKCIVEIEPNFVGEVQWTGAFSGIDVNFFAYRYAVARSIWKKPTGEVIEAPFTTQNNFVGEYEGFTITGDKSQLNNTPPGATIFVGLLLIIGIEQQGTWFNDPSAMNYLHFQEKVLLNDKVQFDSFGQYISNRTNLLDLAPDTSIKELLSNVLQQQGLLLTFEKDSEGVQNIAKLFTYGAYRNKVAEVRAGDITKYYDWSEYHQRYVPPLFNTDYGSMYGEVNEIGLSSPFPGNIGRVTISTNITSQGFQTKLIPLAKNETKGLRDVSQVKLIFNTEPYYEYTLSEQGLVSCSFNEFLGGVRKQYNAELAVSTIDCAPLPKLSNVIYADTFLPIGIKEWYYLVDVAVKCEATFLLPILVLQTLDLSIPVFVESLGGFYIIEEIPEYTDNVTPVKVKLIKLPL
jgi:hypothetical protein